VHGGSKSTSICCFSALHSQLIYIVLKKPEDIKFSFLSSTEPQSKLPKYTLCMPVSTLDIDIFYQVLGNLFSVMYTLQNYLHSI
jgi:hypothetical protein